MLENQFAMCKSIKIILRKLFAEASSIQNIRGKATV